MEDKKGIENFFKKFNISIDLNKKRNESKKKYKISDISKEDMIFLKKHFAKDIKLYNSIPIRKT